MLLNKEKISLITQISLFLILIYLYESNSQSVCESKRTCGECMQAKDECQWCYPKNFGSNQDENKRPQCISSQNSSSSIECNFEKFPQNNVIVERDDNFRSGSLYKPAIQIRPQELKMKIRAGKPEKIRVQYSIAENYPLDLYYLLDFSDSMEDDKDNMSKLSKELAFILGNFTSNFRIGFGSFVDKVVPPFSQTRSLDNPCVNEGRFCVPTYGFRHHLSLTNDTERFSDVVSKAPISGNTDSPEGGFDGLMQAIVCPQIGWRDKAARKLIILSTDALPHIAGDGKLLGIVRPNDGKCHLDAEFKYTHSSLLDYPSIGQIASKAKQHSVSVIFAVPEYLKGVYETLNGFIESSGTAVLTSDSSNIIEILSNTINRITSTVELKDTANAPIKISYKCLWRGSGGPNLPNKCSDFNIRDTIDFDVDIEVSECPEDPSERQRTFEIYPLGLNESVRIHLEILCDCQCEKKGYQGYKENDEMCMGADSKCGVCDCKDGKYGNFCQCDGASILGKETLDQTAGCKPANSTQVCSNRGKCDCGVCVCDKTNTPGEFFYGKYCECSNFYCKMHNGNICSGHSQGKCTCQKCVCAPGWEGDACECTTDKSTCIQPGSSLICGGFGTCECGVCKCHSNSTSTPPTKHEGQYCQKCIGCETHCKELVSCVKCQAFEKTPNCNSTCARDGVAEESNIQILDFVTADPDQDEVDCSQVKIVNQQKKTCIMPFVYRETDDKKIHLKIQKELNCPMDAPLVWIITIPLITTVLIGLVGILIWRVWVHMSDKKEVALLKAEAKDSAWKEENPFYVPATTEHSNPLYAKLNS